MSHVPDLPLDPEENPGHRKNYNPANPNFNEPIPVAVPTSSNSHMHNFGQSNIGYNDSHFNTQSKHCNESQVDQQESCEPTEKITESIKSDPAKNEDQVMDSRTAYLEQWIDNQQMTTSSEDDTNYLDSSSTADYRCNRHMQSGKRPVGSSSKPNIKHK